jgi:ABC-type Fe2+-enterobactin transport system substrate-binding protein
MSFSGTTLGRLKPLGVTAALLALALSLTACSDSVQANKASSTEQTETTADSSGEWPRTVSTDDGDLTLDAQPTTIVSTSTTLTGSLLAVGAPVVASGATAAGIDGFSDDQGFFSQWSAQAKAAGVEKLYENSAPNIEKVAEYEPDLIVVSKNSGDSVFDNVAQLRKIAPVLVIDYSGASWQDVTAKIGEATGHEAEAQKVIADFENHVAEVKNQIQVPSGETSAFIVFADGSGAAALTEFSPQVQVLTELGFTLASIPDEVKGNTEMGADRQDMVNLSIENVQRGLPGENWVVIAADAPSRQALETNEAFSSAPAVVNNKTTYTPGETFRLDYYSATMLVDSLAESFKK